MKAKLPFLITLTPQERKELPKMGDKSIGFDDKCRAYMASNPEFLPGFVQIGEVQKDRELRREMLRLHAEVASLFQAMDDTLLTVNSEIWMADLAFYHNTHEAARRGRPAAQVIYEDLRQRFPGNSGKAAGGSGSATGSSTTGTGSSGTDVTAAAPAAHTERV